MKIENPVFDFHGGSRSWLAASDAMRIAADDLKLDALYVVHPGEQRFALVPGIEAVPLWAMLPQLSHLS